MIKQKQNIPSKSDLWFVTVLKQEMYVNVDFHVKSWTDAPTKTIKIPKNFWLLTFQGKNPCSLIVGAFLHIELIWTWVWQTTAAEPQPSDTQSYDTEYRPKLSLVLLNFWYYKKLIITLTLFCSNLLFLQGLAA